MENKNLDNERVIQMKQELFQFGKDLFTHRYSLEDFASHIEEWAIYKEISRMYDADIASEWIKDTKKKFSGIENIPSYAKALNIIDDPFLFDDIRCGYNSAENKSLESSIVSSQRPKSM